MDRLTGGETFKGELSDYLLRPCSSEDICVCG